jgi:hypothetical protein
MRRHTVRTKIQKSTLSSGGAAAAAAAAPPPPLCSVIARKCERVRERGEGADEYEAPMESRSTWPWLT